MFINLEYEMNKKCVLEEEEEDKERRQRSGWRRREAQVRELIT
jgi:hypothetical protein